MRAAVRWLTRYIALLGVLALPGAGCSQENNNSTADASSTSSSTATAQPIPFVAEARAMTFGTKDLSDASDRDLLELGRVVCDGLGIEGLGFRRVVQRLVLSARFGLGLAAILTALGSSSRHGPLSASSVRWSPARPEDQPSARGCSTQAPKQVEGGCRSNRSLGPCWVRNGGGSDGQPRTAAAAKGSKDPQLRLPVGP
jgi:hypothetical protein